MLSLGSEMKWRRKLGWGGGERDNKGTNSVLWKLWHTLYIYNRSSTFQVSTAEFNMVQTELLPIYSVYCSIKILKLFPRHFKRGRGERERERARKRERGREAVTEGGRMKKMNNSWPLNVWFSARCYQFLTKSGSSTALLYIKILTPISHVSTEHKLEPDCLSMGLCPALGHQLEFLL